MCYIDRVIHVEDGMGLTQNQSVRSIKSCIHVALVSETSSAVMYRIKFLFLFMLRVRYYITVVQRCRQIEVHAYSEAQLEHLRVYSLLFHI